MCRKSNFGKISVSKYKQHVITTLFIKGSSYSGDLTHLVLFRKISFIWKLSSWLALAFALYTEDSPSVPYHIFYSDIPSPEPKNLCYLTHFQIKPKTNKKKWKIHIISSTMIHLDKRGSHMCAVTHYFCVFSSADTFLPGFIHFGKVNIQFSATSQDILRVGESVMN